MLHVEIVLKTKQPEAETSLVYDVFIRVIRKESASWTSDEKKKNKINMWSMWSVKTFYGLIFALKMKWVIMQLIVVNNNLWLGPILASSCTRLREKQHEKTTSFLSARF